MGTLLLTFTYMLLSHNDRRCTKRCTKHQYVGPLDSYAAKGPDTESWSIMRLYDRCANISVLMRNSPEDFENQHEVQYGPPEPWIPYSYDSRSFCPRRIIISWNAKLHSRDAPLLNPTHSGSHLSLLFEKQHDLLSRN
ncbi:hypothetical protein TNCV_5021551 [Trichonephila clavipes]|nr:hypothetical protein TNCV_5021551 [Trichonephila clavipes]